MVLSSLRRSRDERIHFPQFKVQSQMNKSQDAAHYNAVECSNGTLPSTAGTISATRDPNHTCLMAGSWLQYDGSKQQQKRLKLLPLQQHLAVTISPQHHSSSILTAESLPSCLDSGEIWNRDIRLYQTYSTSIFNLRVWELEKILFCSFCQNWFHRRGDCNNVPLYALLLLIRNNIWEIFQIGLFS